MQVGNRIRELRTSRNMTQKDLASIFYVTPQAVSRWENGSAEPSIELIRKIAAYFGVSVDYLIGHQDGEENLEESNDAPVTEVETASQVEVVQKPILAVCEVCNRPIYEGKEIVRRTQGTHRKVTCTQCEQKRQKGILNAATARAYKRRKRSFIFAPIIAIAVLVIGLIITVPMEDTKYTVFALILGVLTFPFVSCLFLMNNPVISIVSKIWSWGMVKFPGLIFSLDLDGIIWLLTVKLLFWIIGFVLSITFLTMGVALGMVLSVFIYPFALRNSYKNPLKDWDD